VSVLIPALFGLLGVVIGGIITAGSNYLLDRRRERAAIQRDERNDVIEIKRAARLIDIEILRAAAATRMMIANKRWPNAKLKTDAWQEYGAVIAPVLSYDDWLTLVKAILAIDSVEWNNLQGEIHDDLVNAIIPLADDIVAGVRVLAPLSQR
jgi:hypothetical protein